MGLLEASPADEAACQGDEGVVEFEASFSLDGEAFELVEEGEGLLDDVAEFAQALDVRGALAGDDRHDPACAQFTADYPGVVRLIGMWVGPVGRARVRDLPAPSWGTRTRPRTTSNCGKSPRCPAVTTIDMGFWPCSTARCSLVVRPPRERPSPWSSGSATMPPGGSFYRSPFFPRSGGRAGGPGRRWSRR